MNNQPTQSFSSQEAASVSNGYNCGYNSMYSAAVPGRSGDILFNQLMASMPTAIAMVDRQMCYVAISQYWQDQYSDSQISDNLLGVSHYQLFPNLPDRWHENAEASLAGTLDSWELETCLSLSDGSIEWVKWVVRRLENGNRGDRWFNPVLRSHYRIKTVKGYPTTDPIGDG
ncbi:hypothetical protein AB3M80_04595 [Arthrospira platensis BEA 1257B]